MKKTNVSFAIIAAIGLGFGAQVLAQDDHHHGEQGTGGHSAGPAHGSVLKTIMVGLGNDMDAIGRALWVEDFRAILNSAQSIAEHPHVSGAELDRIKKALGRDFPSFIAADKQVHDAAVKLSEAAKTHNITATVKALKPLQSGCVSCHATFRARLSHRGH